MERQQRLNVPTSLCSILLNFLCYFILLATGLTNSPARASPDLSTYDLVFSDEFNAAALDTSKWNTAPLWGPYERTNAEDQYYVDIGNADSNFPWSPFSFVNDSADPNGENQFLKITGAPVGLTYEPIPGQGEITLPASAADQPAPPDPDDPNDFWTLNSDYHYVADYDPADRGYLSGLLNSTKSFNLTHGYIEMRAKVPKGQGLWPAFWLHTTKFVGDIPEIDIMEYIGQRPNEVNHTLHYFDVENNWALESTPTYVTPGPDYSQQFHTYAVSWEPQRVVFYVDGEAVRTVTSDDFLISRQSMYIIVNLAIGGTWPGPADSTTPFPAEYLIDYIRAYQKKPIDPITPEVLATEYQLMFSDEFNTLPAGEDTHNTGLSESKWNTDYLWGPYFQINDEEQLYPDLHGRNQGSLLSPFNVECGRLSINAKSVSQADLPGQPAATHAEWQMYPTHQYNPDYLNTWVPGYTSGLLTSYDAFKFVHGYVEIKAKIPSGAGLWPALRLLNAYYVGPLPEIDILELKGEEPGLVYQSYHYYDSNGVLHSSTETSSTGSQNGTYADDFHVYGVEWNPSSINWYIDGVKTRTYNGSTVSLQLMYLLINLAVGGNFVANVDSNALPAMFEIDYVRAYQRRATPVPLESAPHKTTQLAPCGTVVQNTSLDFIWNPTVGAAEYRVFIADQSGTLLNNWYSAADVDCVDGVSSCILSTGLSPSGNARWFVQSRNTFGKSPWSERTNFIISSPLPGVPVLLSPQDATQESPPTFVWEPDEHASEYRLLVRQQSDVLLYQWFSSAETQCANGANPCMLNPGIDISGPANWRVQARNASGKSAWSAKTHFTVGTGTAPGQATTLAPEGNTATEFPVFEWDQVTDAQDYRLLVQDISTNEALVNTWFTAAEVNCSGSSLLCSYTATVPLTGHYKWRVQTRNPYGKGPWSNRKNFEYQQ